MFAQVGRTSIHFALLCEQSTCVPSSCWEGMQLDSDWIEEKQLCAPKRHLLFGPRQNPSFETSLHALLGLLTGGACFSWKVAGHPVFGGVLFVVGGFPDILLHNGGCLMASGVGMVGNSPTLWCNFSFQENENVLDKSLPHYPAYLHAEPTVLSCRICPQAPTP